MSRTIPATAALLAAALAGCDQASEPPANQASALGPADAGMNAATVVMEDEAAVPDVPVAVPAMPKTDGATAAPAAPVQEAAEVADAITRGTGITRVRHGDGWAWMRGDRVIRTASRDGSEVAYFRPGESQPYFIQRDHQSFAYSGGRLVRAYDRNGKPSTADAGERRRAEQAANEARAQHAQAQQAAEQAATRAADERDRQAATQNASAPVRDDDRE